MNLERKFGHDFVKSVLWGAHIGMFYRTSEDIRKIFIPYLAAGLEANERCVWVTSVFSPEETLKLLDERVPDLDIYINKKQLMILSPGDIYLREGFLGEIDNIVEKWGDIYNEALSNGHEGLRIGADASWLKKADFERFIACERATNQVVAENQIIAICAYDTNNFEISDIIAINNVHPYAIVEKNGKWELIESAERIRIKKALEESEEKYRSIFNRAPDGIFLTDLRGNILDANEYICHRVGYTREELIGKNASIINPKEIAAKFSEYAERLLKDGSLTIETKAICRDGSEIQAEANMNMARVSGKECVMIMTRDITARKQAEEALRESEEKLRLIFENAFDGISIYEEFPESEEHRLLECNERYAEMSGRSKEELLNIGNTLSIQRSIEYMSGPPEMPNYTHPYRGLFSWIRPDGRENIIEYTAVPMKIGGRILNIGIDRDITEQRRAEEEIKHRNKELAALNSITSAVNQSLALNEVLDNSLDKVLEVIGLECGCIYLRTGDSEEVTLATYRGASAEFAQSVRTLKFGQSITGKAAQSGEPIVAENLIDDERVESGLVKQEGIMSMASIPLKCKGKLLGVMDIGSHKHHHFAQDEISLLTAVGNQIGVAIENAQLYETLKIERDFNTKLFDTMSEGINLIDVEGKLQFANRRFCEMVGYTLQELKGQPGKLWVHPDDYQQIASHELLRKEGKLSTYECRLLRKDGTEITAILAGAPLFDENGVYRGKVGAVTDITELKQKDALLRESERRYRTMLEDVQMIAIGLDLEGNVTFCNKYFEKVGGYSKDELLGANWFEIMVPERLREEGRRIHDDDVKKDMHTHYEAVILTKSGEERLIEWNNTTLRDTSGNVISTMSLGVDITDQKRMEEQLIRTERMRALGEMTAGIAHNFNNILTGVLGYAELLKYEANLANIASGLEKIEQSAIRARDLVRRMMDFARIGADKKFEVVDLAQVAKESIAISEPRWKTAAEARGISIEMKEEWKGNLLVDGDESELMEVATNMIINSVEAMPKGGTITFRGEKKEGVVFLSISDTGIGMSEDTQKRVFEPFFTTRAEVGRGMGLTTAYGTIRRHGGEIEVQSQLGKGTTFTIKLPYSKSLLEDKKEVIIPKVRQANILVIDDEEQILMVFTQMLKEHQVDTTTNALEGIRLFKEKRHDVLIVDLAMLKMNGWQIADIVRMIDKNVGIVLCTGWGVQKEDEEFKRSQADFLLMKPFEVKVALSTIRQAVKLKDKREKG